jgi:hypothetical protein
MTVELLSVLELQTSGFCGHSNKNAAESCLVTVTGITCNRVLWQQSRLEREESFLFEDILRS